MALRRCGNEDRHPPHDWEDKYLEKEDENYVATCPGTYDHCLNCIEARKKEGLEPQAMTVVGVTTRRSLPVYFCPSCDGKITTQEPTDE